MIPSKAHILCNVRKKKRSCNKIQNNGKSVMNKENHSLSIAFGNVVMPIKIAATE
jgi:hypothetical protein